MHNHLRNKVHQLVNQRIHKRKRLSSVQNVFSKRNDINYRKCHIVLFLQTGGMNNFVDVGLILI